jgi:hypothetical protein
MNNTANAVFALVLLASGYIFLRRWRISRAHVFRSDGHALYFLVVVASFALSLESAVIWEELKSLSVLGQELSHYVDSLLHVFTLDPQSMRLGSTAAISIPLAFATAWVFNAPLDRCASLLGRLLMRLSCFSELEEFLWVTGLRGLPVMITLSSSKVYVGYTMDEPTQSRSENNWIRLEPLLSGYRDDTQRFQLTVVYAFLHDSDAPEKGIVPSDFDVLLPVSDIKSVHAFDLKVYSEIFRKTPDDSGQEENGSNGENKDDVGSVSIKSRSKRTSVNGARTKAENFYISYLGTVALVPIFCFFNGWLLIPIVGLTFMMALASSLPESDEEIDESVTNEGRFSAGEDAAE